MLQPLLKDHTDFVRQGAYVASGLIHMQNVNEAGTTFRGEVSRCIGDKHEDVICRFGALLAQGILDAGGRNMTATFFV